MWAAKGGEAELGVWTWTKLLDLVLGLTSMDSGFSSHTSSVTLRANVLSTGPHGTRSERLLYGVVVKVKV